MLQQISHRLTKMSIRKKMSITRRYNVTTAFESCFFAHYSELEKPKLQSSLSLSPSLPLSLSPSLPLSHADTRPLFHPCQFKCPNDEEDRSEILQTMRKILVYALANKCLSLSERQQKNLSFSRQEMDSQDNATLNHDWTKVRTRSQSYRINLDLEMTSTF